MRTSIPSVRTSIPLGLPPQLGPPRIAEPSFLQAVTKLYDPRYGTEQLAPLLYWMLRFTRPAVVVELGGGHTSPFIAQALRDSGLLEEQERFREGYPGNASMNLLHRYYKTPPINRSLTIFDEKPQLLRVRAVLEELGLQGPSPTVTFADGDVFAVGRLAHDDFEGGSIDVIFNDLGQ